MPQRIPGRAGSLTVGAGAVRLHAVGIHVEEVHVLVVVERVQVHHGPVVRHDLIVLGETGPNQLRVVLADKGDVDVVVIVGKKCRRRLAHRIAVARPVLPEIGDGEFGLARHGVQEVIEHRRPADARDPQGPHLGLDDFLLGVKACLATRKQQDRDCQSLPHQISAVLSILAQV